MNRLGAGAAVASLALGCGHTRQQAGDCPTCGGGHPPPVVSSVAVPAVAPAAPVDHETASPPPAAGPRGGFNAMTIPRTERFPATLPAPAAVTAALAPAPAAAPRYTVSDTPTGGYMHNPDYTALVGELQQNPRQGTWRLRYAPVDEEDRYGGCVTLDGSGRMMQGFRHGQRVRVEGALADPDSRELSPAYRVRDVYPLAE
jgi:hypothetical protein